MPRCASSCGNTRFPHRLIERALSVILAIHGEVSETCQRFVIVLFLNNLTLSTFRHPILQARKGKNNYEKHYKSLSAKQAFNCRP